MVGFNAKGVKYSTPSKLGSRYKWTIDKNAKINSADDKDKITVDFQALGTDSVIIHVLETDSNDCVKDTFIIIRIEKTTGIQNNLENKTNYSIKKYGDIIDIEWDDTLNASLNQIQMYDVLGKDMYNMIDIEKGKNRLHVKVNSLKSGVYVLLLRYDASIHHVPILIE